MRVLRVRTGGELDRDVAGGEIDVEPCDQGVDVIASLYFKGERDFEGQVVDGDGVEVEGYDADGVGDAGFHFDDVDEGFG